MHEAVTRLRTIISQPDNQQQNGMTDPLTNDNIVSNSVKNSLHKELT